VSLRVLVIPEDPTYNGYLLKPLAERMLAGCGRARAKVTILTNPRAAGYEHAKRLIRDDLIPTYRSVDLMLFLPDRDGQDRAAELHALEEHAAQNGVTLLCCAAVEEVEVWALAGHTEKLAERWQDVRANINVKEQVFLPFLAKYGSQREPGEGRKRLMHEAMQNYRGVLARCDELARLEQRIREHLNATTP